MSRVRRLLHTLGVPSSDIEALSPALVSSYLHRITDGYHRTPAEVVGDALFDDAGAGPVVVRDIPFVSLGRHDLVPFEGRAHLAYLPGDRVVGLSKLARLVDLFAHRLQTADRLASDVAESVEYQLAARGVWVRIEAGGGEASRGRTVVAQAVRGEFVSAEWRRRLAGLLHCPS